VIVQECSKRETSEKEKRQDSGMEQTATLYFCDDDDDDSAAAAASKDTDSAYPLPDY